MPSPKPVVFPLRLDAATMRRFERVRTLWRKKSVPKKAIDAGFPKLPASEFMRFVITAGLADVEKNLKQDKEIASVN